MSDGPSRDVRGAGFAIHPQLLADCHRLGALELGCLRAQLLLQRNALLPWLILVPETAHSELLALPREQREALLDAAAELGRLLLDQFGCDKLNVAALGNVVPQLHLHLIARRAGDACWPKPVWGHLSGSAEYPAAQIDALRRGLVDRLGLIVDSAAPGERAAQ